MSLTLSQKQATRNELQINFERSGKSLETIAVELGISEEQLNNIFQLQNCALEDPWILRNYLLEKVTEKGEETFPFSALKGDYHDYWFLNAEKIEHRVL